jgi:membrane fusion protein (multidrug efflux system)
MGRTGWIAVGAILVLGGVAALWRGGLLPAVPGIAGAGPAAQPAAVGTPAMPPVTVEMAVVEIGTIEDGIGAVGSLIANEAIVLRPEIPGRVQRILFQEGEKVAEGAPLVELDPSTYKAELDQAQADLGLAKANYDRATTLFAQKTGTARAVDEASAALNATRARMALAQAQLAKTTIHAPFAGHVGLRRFSVGDVLSPGQELANLVALDPIKVDFRVPETRLPAIAPGQTLDLTVDALPGRSFRGTVYAIDPLVEAQGRAILLRARVPNPDGALRPGLFARVNLIVTTRQGAILVPEQAIVPVGDRQTVFKVVDGKASAIDVKLGIRRNGKAEVVEGLKPGDQIVTAGQLKLRDGAPVAPAKPATGT